MLKEQHSGLPAGTARQCLPDALSCETWTGGGHVLRTHRSLQAELPGPKAFNPISFSFCMFRWTEWNPGFPLSIDAKCHKDLPRDIQFDSEKGVDFVLNYSKA